MKTVRKLGLTLAVALALGASTVASAQTIGYNTRTGDVWVDSRLGEINDYGRQYRDPFIGEMTGYYGAPRSLVTELLDQRRWSPGDVYYACAIASVLNLPCRDVVREYDRNPGQGWGNIAKRMGIKPGSPQFHALKRGTANTYDRWGYPISIDRNVRVDWSKHGPGKGKGGDKAGKGKAAAAHYDGMDHGPGNSAKGHGPDKGKGADKGNSGKGNAGGKDNGKDNGKGKGNGKPS